MKKISLVLLALLLSACAPQGIQIPQSPALKLLEPKAGQIAYIGNDGNIYLTDQAAGNTTQLTNDLTPETQNSIAYQLPTWSRDSGLLAFVRLEQAGTKLTADVMVTDVETETTRSIYTSDHEYPFFMYWSPDGNSITALTTTASQSTLALQNISLAGGEPAILDTGNPFYWSWAPDSKTMIVHKNGGNPNLTNQLSFLKLDDDTVTEFVLLDTPGSFQAPAWSPNGAHILLTVLSENRQKIVLTNSTGEILRTISEYDLNTSFAWAPDSLQYAYIAGTEQMQEGSIGTLHIGNIENESELVIDDPVFAYFWSPDSREIAYLVPFVTETESETDSQLLYFRLYVADTTSGESREVVTFQPTESFLALVPYIGQYHQATTIWSPDSNNLVISFVDQNGGSGIAVVPSSGITEPRLLVQGSFAAWSWK